MKMELTLRIPLYTKETLLKYVGGLHSYLRYTIIIFNPNNLDEVCFQSTDIESRGKNDYENFPKKPIQPIA
jgi:hypothetical protein